jgi:hypothetical protein
VRVVEEQLGQPRELPLRPSGLRSGGKLEHLDRVSIVPRRGAT